MLASSYKSIRGNSYGMWIGTEINLHHKSFVQEAFNRSIAADKRKIWWDLNPDNPKAGYTPSTLTSTSRTPPIANSSVDTTTHILLLTIT